MSRQAGPQRQREHDARGPLDLDDPLRHQDTRKALIGIVSGLRQGDTVMDVASRIIDVVGRIDRGELDAAP